MAWTLKINPQGILYSKFLKNYSIYNSNSTQFVETSHFLSDYFSTNLINNTVDLRLNLSVYDNNPLNLNTSPNITGIVEIAISNDPDFQQVLVLSPDIFSAYYNNNTNYVYDCNSLSVSNLTLPSIANIKFSEVLGQGTIILKNWPLSDGAGKKRVFYRVVVGLSDGSTASYPVNYGAYDDVIVFTNEIIPPEKPIVQTKVSVAGTDYTLLPALFSSYNASNSNPTDADSGISVYYWDCLVLPANKILYRNNPSNVFSFFNNVGLPNTQINTDLYSYAFTGLNTSYQFVNALPALSSSNNLTFFEGRFINNNISYNTLSTAGFTYQFFISTSSLTSNFVTATVSISNRLDQANITLNVDNGVGLSSNVYTNTKVIGQMIQGGKFIVLAECFDFINKLIQFKILYNSPQSNHRHVLFDNIFASSSLISNSFRFGVAATSSGTSSQLILEASQYGVCFGTLSAAILPSDKIEQTNFVSNTQFNNYSNDWFTLTNSPYAAVVGLNANSNILTFNNNIGYSTNQLVVSEIQSSIPTFYENSIFTINLNSTANSTGFRAGYSFDDNLNFNNYIFSNDLLSSAGAYLPQSLYSYNILSNLQWSDNTKNFILNIQESDTNEICNISSSVTTNLIVVSGLDSSPNQTIKTKHQISTSITYSAWINTQGYSTSSIYNQVLSFTNTGDSNISISTSSISTISPNQSFVFSSLSTQQAQPTIISVLGQTNTISKSINFIFDCGSVASSIVASFNISPLTSIPSFQYSVETSNDFLNFSYISITPTATYSPSTSSIKLQFSLQSNSARFVRVRLYYNASATFDPRQNYVYSGFSLSYSSGSAIQNGKLIFGFTDTSAKNTALNTLYNQPTYLRTLQSSTVNNSKIIAVGLDYSDYNANNSGPVYLTYITESGESRIKVFESGFSTSLSMQLSVTRQPLLSGYKLGAQLSLGFTTFNFDHLLAEENNKSVLDFGYYPFISLLGNGNFTVTSAIGSAQSSLFTNQIQSNFSLFTANDPNDSPNFGKNLIYQNTYNPAPLQFPAINGYFSYNPNIYFDYTNVTFTVKSVNTAQTTPYGPAIIDNVYVTSGDYVLLTGQTDKTQNGIYEVSTGQWNLIYPGNTNILVSEGTIFAQTLWSLDTLLNDWVSNVIRTPIIVNDSSLLVNAQTFKIPNYLKIAISLVANQNASSYNQVQVKLVNSPKGYISNSDLATQWQGINSPTKFHGLQFSGPSNHNNFAGVLFNASQIQAIQTNLYPTIINVLVSYSGSYIPVYSNGTQIILPDYGTSYRMFCAPQMCLQAFSTLSTLSYNSSTITGLPVHTGLYAQNVANNTSPQSEYSDLVVASNVPPSIGILTVLKDNVKNVLLGISSFPASNVGLLCARVVQVNPIGEKIYGNWFGYQGQNGLSTSFIGLTSIVAYPSAVTGIQTYAVEPLSGFYRYKLQVIDNLGNWSETNEITSFYYENAILDTQPPVANVSFVQSDYSTPLQVASSNVVNAQLNAFDYTTGVKAYQYKVGTSAWSNWIDYNTFVNVFLDDTLPDGNITVQFRFKDYAENIMSPTSTAVTYSIVSRLLNNVVLTVMATSGNSLYIGGSQSGAAVLYLWNNNTFTSIFNSYLSQSKSVSAIKTLSNGTIIVGTDLGYIFAYENNTLNGPYTQLTWSGVPLAITKFHEHLFSGDTVTTVLASTLNIPRIFYSSLNQIHSKVWNVLQPQNPYITSVNFTNAGLWTGNQIYYNLSSSYSSAQLSISQSYGISSGILVQAGSNYNFNNNNTTVQASGPISNFYATVIGQGGLYLTVLPGYNGIGYTNGTYVVIDPPAPGIGATQAYFTPVLDSFGSIQQLIPINPNADGTSGFGYTQKPNARIVGVGTGAVLNPQINYNAVWGINVVSPGVATTTSITLSIIGAGTGAIINPSFLYRINNVSITSPGFGYISNPNVYVNGLSTIITASVQYGSVQNIGFNSNFTFPVSTPLTYSISGGFATDYNLSFGTSSVQYLNNGVLSTGTIISSITLLNPGLNIANRPSISFSSSLYNPDIVFNLSDDTLFNSPSGTIYDMKSFGSSIFVSSSQGGLVYVNKQNGIFTASKYYLNQFGNDTTRVPFSLANYNNTVYFSLYNSDLIGYVINDSSNLIFNDRNLNILNYKPYNFDILADWQLIKNASVFSDGGIGTATADLGIGTYAGLLRLTSYNSQIYYDSTKSSTWLDRLNSFNESSVNSVNYAVQLNFASIYGTQSLEITTYYSILKVNFIVSSDLSTLTINVASSNTNIYSYNIPNDISGQLIVEFVKSGTSLAVYSNTNGTNNLIANLSGFFVNAKNPNTPVFRFGEIFKTLLWTSNSASTNYFGVPPQSVSSSSPIFNSQFIWKQIKFAFQNNEISFSSSTNINLYVPYNLNKTQPIQFLASLGSTLFSVVKGNPYFNSSTIVNDNSVKIYSLNTSANIFNDVTGNFEIFSAGLSSSYIISSAFDMAAIGTSYFITGVTQNTNLNPYPSPYILLGLSSNIVYEEEDTYLTVLYPNQLNKNGTTLNISCNNSIVNIPSSIFFSPSNVSQVISIGLGSTATNTSATIAVTDGQNVGYATINILPLSLSSIAISTTSFVAYSNSLIVLNLGLPHRTVSPRTINVTSSMPSILYPVGGLATIYPQTSNTQLTLQMGVGTTSSGTVLFNATYRNTLSTSLTVYPMQLSASLSTNIFVAGAVDNPVYITASVQTPVWTSLNISASSNVSGIFTTPNNSLIIGAAKTQIVTLLTQVGFATTSSSGVYSLSIVGSNIGLGFTVLPFTFNTVIDNSSPVFPYQTPTVTYTLNNVPFNNLNIYNHVTPTGILTYAPYVTFATGEILQAFTISTTLALSPGLAITVYGTLY